MICVGQMMDLNDLLCFVQLLWPDGEGTQMSQQNQHPHFCGGYGTSNP